MLKSTLVGLQLADQLTFDRWREVGVKICRYRSANSWWIGDWLIYGQSHYGERYKRGVAETGLASREGVAVRGFEAAEVSYPGFERDLGSLTSAGGA